jgi:hypothetical protein
MKSRINHDLLPILTETADGTILNPPVLTEAVRQQAPAAPALDERQCRELAERLFPRLETTLREAIGSRSEARWEKAMQQIRAALPDLIRDSAGKPR